MTYTISSKNTLSTTGTAPTGSSASISETYSNSKQMTKGNSQTLTLTGWNGYSISNITLSMKSNASGGAGNLAYSTDGGITFTYLVGTEGNGTYFNDHTWHSTWSSTYVDISKDVEIEASASNIVIKISATANSLYCQSYKITYDTTSSSSAKTTTTTIDDSGITNTNKYVSTDAGSFRATVKDESDKKVDGATVTWSSSNEDVATIDDDGVVTLVASGTTTITATYAGVDGVYKSSSGTYPLTVTNEDPDIETIWSEDFSDYSANAVPTGGTYSYACVNSSSNTKVYNENNAGGKSPELLVGKSSGSFTAVIPLLHSTYGYSGDLTMTFKSNAYSITVTSGTTGVTVDGEASVGAGVSFSTKETHTVTFKGVTTETSDITIVFAASSSSNVRLDDIVLKGKRSELTVVATPVITPFSGAVAFGTEVDISCATGGATIYYTTDGSTPTSSSTVYDPDSKPTITAATTIKAIGIKAGLTDSGVASASYTIAEPCATPTFSVAEGTVDEGTEVSLSCATDGATIYYTTDGTTPTTSSDVYSSALTINSSQTIKAIAAKDGMAYSAVASATYTIRDYANLPFVWDGGPKTNLNAVTGVTTSGLGSDYAAGNAPYYTRMDGEGDYIQVKTDTKPGKVYVGIKMIGGSDTSKIKVQESADGTNFTDVEELTISGSQNDVLNLETSKSFAVTTRYVKIIKSQHGSNIGVGPITITGCEIVTIGPANYTTYTTTGNICFPEGVTGYIATSTTASTVTLTSKESVPASTPIVLKATAGTYYLPIITTTPDDVSDNILLASDGSVKGDGSTIYALGLGKTGANKGKVGFYLVDENVVIPAGKAYLNLGGSPAKEFLTFDFSETPDGIKTLSQTPVKEEGIYNLSGQRLNKMQKGINIVNGKKVLY